MFKAISITLPEKMIRQIDEALINSEFSCRSEFFRVLIRMWFDKSDQKVLSNSPDTLPNTLAKHNQTAVDAEIDSEVDLEYGIPPELVKKFAEKAKFLNK